MANPTTNFGWVMPTSASLVTNLPADFNVFGQAVDTSMQYLLGGTTGQILSKTSATNMAFTWIANDQGDITGVTAGTGISVTSPTGPVPTVAIDTAVTVDKTTAQTLTNKTLTSPALTTPTISTATTNGDLLYGTGSGALTRLGIGSTSQVLTVTGGVPAWATPAGGGGKVLQVVQATFATETATSSTTYSDTGLTGTITPTSATSKVYVIAVMGGLLKSAGNVNNAVHLKLLRGATAIVTKTGYLASGNTTGTQMDGTLSYLDSPATTSATTYKVQFANAVAAAEVYICNANNIATIILMEIGA